MDGAEFLDILSRIVGAEDAQRHARRFGPLDHEMHGYSELLNYEGLAFYAYSTGMNWYDLINSDLWSRRPSKDVLAFRDVLNAALEKLPRYTINGGTVFRGYQVDDLDSFLQRYEPGKVVDFPGFTSAAYKQENAFGGNVLFMIRVLTARAIWYVAAQFGEFEVLIPAGKFFRVLSTERHGDIAVVTLEEMP
jgi:hypothetical protein